MADLLGDGNVKVTWVPAIASISAPTVAELTAGSTVDLQCLITADGLGISGETAAVDNSALCSTDDTESPGRVKFEVELTCKRKDNVSEDKAWTTLVNRALGYLVVRRDKPHAQPYVAGDKVEVYPVQCGMPVMQAPEKNSVQKFMVKLFVRDQSDNRATVA